MHIAFFDSGLGGMSVAQALLQHPQIGSLPLRKVSYLADTGAYPYGDKADDWLNHRILNVVTKSHQELEPDMWVIACNTASTLVLDALRRQIRVPIVGVVPAIKPAALATKSGVIGVLATPATVKRNYTAQLIADHAPGCQVLLHGSDELVHESEKKLLGAPPNEDVLRRAVAAMLDQADGHRIDTVVLGCTHYPLIKEELALVAPTIRYWMDSGDAIARRVISLATGTQQTAIETLSLGILEVGIHALAINWYVTGGPTSDNILGRTEQLTQWLLGSTLINTLGNRLLQQAQTLAGADWPLARN